MASRFALDPKVLATLTEAERKEVEAELELVIKALDENPLNTYNPHEKQRQFHSSHSPIKGFVGGNRSGKSTAGVADDLIQALPLEDVPSHLRDFKRFEPPFYGRVITPDLGHTMEVVTEKFRRMCPPHALWGKSWERSYDKTRRVLKFDCGSRIDFMSTEQDVNKFGGIALHRVHYDEEPSGPNSQKIRQECQFRLIDYDGDEIFTFTPLFGMSWVYDEIWEKRHDKGFHIVQVDMDDNPHLSEDAKTRILAGYSDDEKRQRKSGEFVHLAGLFFDEFQDALHVVKAPEKKDLATQSIVVSIDPGLARTAVVWIAFDNDNSALVFSELYESETLIPDIASQIKRINQMWGVKPAYIIDPSARNRATVNAEQIEAEYAREGIFCAHGQNARGPGILEMKRRLQQGTLVVSKDCRNLIWEFGRYRKDPNAPDEFAAIKQDDHLLDALRYGVMSRAWHLPQRQRENNFNRRGYDPKFQIPYSQERPIPDSPPLGAMS